MPQTLLDQGEIHVARDQVGGQGVLEGVRVALLWR
jgi:hypothetical protein